MVKKFITKVVAVVVLWYTNLVLKNLNNKLQLGILIMIIAIVTFEIDKELNDTVLKEKFLETSPIYKDTPGLIRKNYICDTSKNLAGGVYCFDNLENAKSWFDEDRVKWITERYSAPDIRFYENPVIVDNNTDEIIS